MPPDRTAITQQNPKLLPLVHSFEQGQVLRDGLRLVEQPKPAEVARPEALREAASIGASALDWGELKGFCIEHLQTYLNDRSKKVIAARWRIRQVVARK